MTFYENLTALRRARGWSQEELGERLGVTRQTVSKWELGSTTPELEKLVEMSKLFGISIDELVKGNSGVNEEKLPEEDLPKAGIKRVLERGEYKSQKTVCGMPLVHITARGTAKGFVAIGIRARGVVSLGVLSAGVLSLGVLSAGVIAIGFLALGVFAQGAAALGVFAMGGAAAGLFSFGGVSAGWLSWGGASVGKYAFGGYASGDIAVGGMANGIVVFGEKGKATGEIVFSGEVTAEEFRAAIMSRLPNTPKFVADLLSWLAENTSVN